MNDITNTSKQDAIIHLAGSLGEGMSGYVEGMEKRGQRELVNSTRLPAECRGLSSDWNADGWDELATLGFVKGAPVDGDELFVEATLPAGWTRESAGHAMWPYLLDERGIRRVAVFYKAAFYDRRAHMSLMRAGSDWASNAIYGDDPVALPEFWARFTNEERQQVADYLAGYRADAAKYPDIYGDRLPRVDAIEQLVAAAAGQDNG